MTPTALRQVSTAPDDDRRTMTSTEASVTEPPERRSASSIAHAAARDIRGVSPGVIAFGLMLGVTVVTLHAGRAEAVLGAVLVFGGSAQLTTVTVLHLGSGVVAAVLSGAVVNARIMLYGAALEPWFRDQPTWFRLLAPHFIQDQTYLSAVERTDLRGRDFRIYWAWAGLLLLLTWTASVVTGLALGPVLPPLPHLALVGTALFVSMLVSRLVDRAAAVAAAVACGVAVVLIRVVPELGILGGTAAGVLAALAVGGRHGRTHR
jgi:predicted branched-subunit amino acid permease